MDDLPVKMIGFGLASAIAIDATVVRLLILPAVMTLLGEANWWMPSSLERLLPAPRAAVAVAPTSERERELVSR
jgi:RND superfamily putative drug exporter